MNISFVFGRYARPCSYRNGDGEVVSEMRAYISPLRYKNKMYIYGVNTEIGYNPEGYYRYIGPPEADITGYEDESFIECNGEKYRIDRAEKEYMGTDVFYIWAILRKMVETEEEDNE